MGNKTLDQQVHRNHAVAGEPVIDPADWTGKELEADDSWIIRLEEDALSDLKDLADQIRPKIKYDPNVLLSLTKEDLPIGRFAGTVEEVREILTEGVGLSVLRGLPVGEWDRLDLMTAYWAMGRHLGRALSNNGEGDMIGHVLNAGKDYDKPNHRGYQTNVTMDYHIDQCDVVGLLCLQTSKSGGKSKLASSSAVYNELLKCRPDLVKVMTEPYYWTRHGEIGPGQKPWYTSPILNFLDGYLCVSCGPKHIEKGHLLPGTPNMTAEQQEAITVWEEICEDLHAEIAFEVGDIQLLNSAVTMHTRTEFEDWPDLERRRHLWRLWLSLDNFRPRTPYFETWKNGVQVEGMTERLRVDYLEGGG